MPVEIHTDKAASKTASMLRIVPKRIQTMKLSPKDACVENVPYNPIKKADVTKAAHKPVNVVDATTKMTKPLWIFGR